MDELSPPLVGPTREGLCFDCPGVLIAASAHPRLRDTARFVTAAGERHVICALAPPSNLRSRVWRVRADLLGMPNGDWVVTAVRNDEGLDPLTLTPESFCPIAGAVHALRSLADSITRESLRRFLADSFADFRVFEDFWQAQAGPDHHHWPCKNRLANIRRTRFRWQTLEAGGTRHWHHCGFDPRHRRMRRQRQAAG